ncbi:hypothetical protein V1477_016048 [Vespula maculifrons]|uniref:Uncharacterized protein n=1 Tax=Vespula maculifrons TaxID=7453 RepID=A0ABD2BBW6_VESMC
MRTVKRLTSLCLSTTITWDLNIFLGVGEPRAYKMDTSRLKNHVIFKMDISAREKQFRRY